jgi:predicted  nucleic acid-binding Zn-ribbon protein
MTEINSNSPTPSPELLLARMEILKRKLAQLNGQLANVMTERRMMENKIADAQTRIQKILNKLPQTPDTRQLNLLDSSPLEAPSDE